MRPGARRALRLACCLAAAARAQRPEADPLRDGVYLRSARLPVVADGSGGAGGGGDGAAAVDGDSNGSAEGGGGKVESGDNARYAEQLIMYDFRPLLPPYTRERLQEALLLPPKAEAEAGRQDDETIEKEKEEDDDGEQATDGDGGDVGKEEIEADGIAGEGSAGDENGETSAGEASTEEEGESPAADGDAESSEESSKGTSVDAIGETEKEEPMIEKDAPAIANDESNVEAPAGELPSEEAPNEDSAKLAERGDEKGAESEEGEPTGDAGNGDDAAANLSGGEELAEPDSAPDALDDAVEQKEVNVGSLEQEEVLEGDDAPESPAEASIETNGERAPETPDTATEVDAEQTENTPDGSGEAAVDSTIPEARESDDGATEAEKEESPKSDISDAAETPANVPPEEKIAVHYDDESTISSSANSNVNANKDANRQFVDGLDEIDKLFESVDVPDELDVGADGSSLQDVLVGQGLKIAWKRARAWGRAVRGRFDQVAGSVKRALPLGILDGARGEESEDGSLESLLDLGKLREETASTKEEGTGTSQSDNGKEKKKRQFPLVRRKEVQRIWKFARRKWQQAKHILDDLFDLFDDDEDEVFSFGDMKLDNIQLGQGRGDAPNFGSDVDDSFLRSRYEEMVKQGQQPQ
ncbi:hypothetical protein ACHAXT_009009 [Thalassiosira profunda]